jgi:tyrosine decarboxylase / aspartate 1-decarboxylase
MTLDKAGASLLGEALERLDNGFAALPAFDPNVDLDGLRTVLLEVADRMADNFPYHHPQYAGQMLKPPHPVARLAYMLSLWINPNNHALDGGRCSSFMEKEAVAEIACMFGWDTHLGHLCGGGTMANLEALYVARCLHPGKRIVASKQAHYTHERISGVLNIPFTGIPCDAAARMDLDALRYELKKGDVGTVVATIGTTATGSVDPLIGVLGLQEEFGFRIHADAAYGGYYVLVDNLRPETRAVYDHLSEVDSLVIDPHKHGLQPYGCGCVLFKDPSVGKFYQHESPYTYFTSKELHLGEISLECSRPGSSAVALWATQRLLPLKSGGVFAGDLAKCRSAALKLFTLLASDDRFLTAFPPELDIVIWAPRAKTASESSRLAAELFDACAQENLHLAKAQFPRQLLASYWPDMVWDQETMTCMRSVLMKPEHEEWVDRLYGIIGAASGPKGM